MDWNVFQLYRYINRSKIFLQLDLTAACIDLKIYADYPQAKKLAKISFDALIRRYITRTQPQEFMRAIAFSICGKPALLSWFIRISVYPGPNMRYYLCLPATNLSIILVVTV